MVNLRVKERELKNLSPVEPLTGREKDVLCLIAQGYTSSQAAEELCLDTRTVEGRRTVLKEKLGLPADRRTHLIELLHYARAEGLI